MLRRGAERLQRSLLPPGAAAARPVPSARPTRQASEQRIAARSSAVACLRCRSLCSGTCHHSGRLGRLPTQLSYASNRGPLDQRIRHALAQKRLDGSSLVRSFSSSVEAASEGWAASTPSFFSSARPEPSSSAQPQPSSSSSLSSRASISYRHDGSFDVQRFSPEVVEPSELHLGSEFDSLCRPLRDHDEPRSWAAFLDLTKDPCLQIPQELLASLCSLVAQQPSHHDLAAIDEVCRKLMHIRKATATSSESEDLESLEPSIYGSIRDGLFRLLYLLLLKAESQLASDRQSAQQALPEFVSGARDCLASLDAIFLRTSQGPKQAIASAVAAAEPAAARAPASARHGRAEQFEAELELLSRVSVWSARLGDVPFAVDCLTTLVRYAGGADVVCTLTSETFEEVLEAATAQVAAARSARQRYLPSPVDELDSATPSTEVETLLRAVRATVAADVAPTKAALHSALEALDTSTLRSLLPFEPQDSSLSRRARDVARQFVSRWHPWENDTDGLPLSRTVAVHFGDRVALVLAKRRDIAPALHILETRTRTGLPTAGNTELEQPDHTSQAESASVVEPPDSDLFVAALSVLASRIWRVGGRGAQLDQNTYRSVANDLRVVMRIYSSAVRAGVEMDTALCTEVIHALTVLVRIGVVKIGRSDFRNGHGGHKRAHMAHLNEAVGARDLLRLYLRRLTTSILSQDPSLRGGSLSLSAHASLLGLHMRARDYSFSKRLYQLFRLREPLRDLWSSDQNVASLHRIALNPISAPDYTGFGWLFVEAVKTSPRPHFATRLYLDWIASGRSLSPDFTAIYVQALLKAGFDAVAERLLLDLHQERAVVPAHLARTFVDKFSEAGYPEQAVQMAFALTRAWTREGQALIRSGGGDPDQSGETDRNELSASSSDSLRTALEIYSIALDKASRSRLDWTTERRVGLFRLFDDFRLALGHFLRRDASAVDESGTMTSVSIRYIRDAYNAAMRTHLENDGTLLGLEDPYDATYDDLTARPLATQDRTTALEITRQQIVKLVEELKDLSIEPDSTTWSLLILADLTTVVDLRTTEPRLIRAARTFMQGSNVDYLADGPLILGEGTENLVHLPEFATRRRQAKAVRKPVQVASAIAGRLIIYLARAKQYSLARSVYSVWRSRQASVYGQEAQPDRAIGWDKGVEGARIYLLAAEGKSDEWKRELVKLTKRQGYQPHDAFVRRLEALDENRGSRPRDRIGPQKAQRSKM